MGVTKYERVFFWWWGGVMQECSHPPNSRRYTVKEGTNVRKQTKHKEEAQQREMSPPLYLPALSLLSHHPLHITDTIIHALAETLTKNIQNQPEELQSLLLAKFDQTADLWEAYVLRNVVDLGGEEVDPEEKGEWKDSKEEYMKLVKQRESSQEKLMEVGKTLQSSLWKAYRESTGRGLLNQLKQLKIKQSALQIKLQEAKSRLNAHQQLNSILEEIPKDYDLADLSRRISQILQTSTITGNKETLQKIRNLMGQVLETRGARNYISAKENELASIGSVEDIKVYFTLDP